MKFQCGACGTEATVQDGLPTYDADRLVLIMEAHAKGCPGFPPTSATGDFPPTSTTGDLG